MRLRLATPSATRCGASHTTPLGRTEHRPNRLPCCPRRRHPTQVQRRGGQRRPRVAVQSSWEEERVPDAIPSVGQDSDWRDFRAKLAASSSTASASSQELQDGAGDAEGMWAHSLPGPEKGAVVLAHPLMFTMSQTYLSQSVVFLYEHNEKGSAGLMLNRPTRHVMGSIDGADFLCPEFADNTLFLGGDVGRDTVHVLHGHGDLKGAVEVVKGVFIGGFEDAKERVANGTLQPETFRWFARYTGWGPGQLEDECKAGVWFPAATDPKFILSPTAAEGREFWHKALQLLGGDLAQLSEAVRDSEDRSYPPKNDSGESGA